MTSYDKNCRFGEGTIFKNGQIGPQELSLNLWCPMGHMCPISHGTYMSHSSCAVIISRFEIIFKLPEIHLICT